MFCGLRLQGQPDRFLVSNIFKDIFSKEGTGEEKATFEGGFKFAASKVRKKFDRTDSADQGEIGEQSGSDRGASD